MKLVIFDMDQTLVDFVPVHDKAVEHVFREFFHVNASLAEIDFSGRSLTDILIVLAGRKGIPEARVRENIQELLESYEREFNDNFPADPSPYILPGVKGLLERLSQTGYLVVLYTGDSASIVHKVLTETSLGKYFAFSVHGAEARTRSGMIELAVDRAEELTGSRFEGKDVVVIGDSVRDIDSGKQVQALIIAVATGSYSAQELSQHNPDHLFANLADHEAVLEAIG